MFEAIKQHLTTCGAMKRIGVRLMMAAILAEAALPPGFDEELFCPPQTCLKGRIRPHGFCGAKSAFHECCNEATGETTVPRSWGVRVALSVRESLIQNGWSNSTRCTRWDGQCGERRSLVLLGAMLNAADKILLGM